MENLHTSNEQVENQKCDVSQETLNLKIDILENIDIATEPIQFFNTYICLLQSLSGTDLKRVTEFHHNRIQKLSIVWKNTYITTILAEKWLLYVEYEWLHYEAEKIWENSISDFPKLEQLYRWKIAKELLDRSIPSYKFSHTPFEWKIDPIITKRSNPKIQLAAFAQSWIEMTFTRTEDSVVDANEISHIAFSYLFSWYLELKKYLHFRPHGKSLYMDQLKIKNLHELNQFVSDVWALTSIENNIENKDKLLEEITRIFTYSVFIDKDSDKKGFWYESAVEFMRDNILQIMQDKGASIPEIHRISQARDVYTLSQLLRNQWLDLEDMKQIQHIYFKKWEEALSLVEELRDFIIEREELLKRGAVSSYNLTLDETQKAQELLAKFWYYWKDEIDWIWGQNTQAAYETYARDRRIYK